MAVQVMVPHSDTCPFSLKTNPPPHGEASNSTRSCFLLMVVGEVEIVCCKGMVEPLSKLTIQEAAVRNRRFATL